MRDTVIIGGGLAGLIAATELAAGGYPVTVVEKKAYPFHRVCGEYISNEVKPFLESRGLYPADHRPSQINTFWLTATNGKKAVLPLEMGAFGISRYRLDEFLYKKALEAGVTFLLKETVNSCTFTSQEDFKLSLSSGKQLRADYVIGAFGKRSVIDRTMKREFLEKRSPYVGVKYHVKSDMPGNVIALHNFLDGYCGVSRIEGGLYNVCYLTTRDNVKKYGSVAAMEEAVLYRNPYLKTLFTDSEFIFDRPEVINEISFERKEPVKDHILMAGDAAGLITPLCGNGMAMAIHSGKILAEIMISHRLEDRVAIELAYSREWTRLFRGRLTAGRQIQKLFGSDLMSNIAVKIASYSAPAAKFLIKQTHGQVF